MFHLSLTGCPFTSSAHAESPCGHPPTNYLLTCDFWQSDMRQSINMGRKVKEQTRSKIFKEYCTRKNRNVYISTFDRKGPWCQCFICFFMATDYAYLIYASQVVGRRVPTRDSKVLIAVVRVASSNPLKKLGFFMIFPFCHHWRSGPGSSRLHWWRTSGPLLSFQWRKGPKRQVPHLSAFPGIWHQIIVVVPCKSIVRQKHQLVDLEQHI